MKLTDAHPLLDAIEQSLNDAPFDDANAQSPDISRVVSELTQFCAQWIPDQEPRQNQDALDAK